MKVNITRSQVAQLYAELTSDNLKETFIVEGDAVVEDTTAEVQQATDTTETTEAAAPVETDTTAADTSTDTSTDTGVAPASATV